MMPPCSAFDPTMKPVMFCRNTSGVSVRLHSWMNCAPFSASSENRIPLLPSTPDREPADRAPAAHELVAVERLELLEPAAVEHPGEDLAHVERHAHVGRRAPEQLARVVRGGSSAGSVGAGAELAPAQVAHDVAADAQRVQLVDGEVVRQPARSASASRRRRASPRRRSRRSPSSPAADRRGRRCRGPSRTPCSRSCPGRYAPPAVAGPNPSVIDGMPSLESWVRFLKPAPPRHEDVGLPRQVGAGRLVEA